MTRLLTGFPGDLSCAARPGVLLVSQARAERRDGTAGGVGGRQARGQLAALAIEPHARAVGREAQPDLLRRHAPGPGERFPGAALRCSRGLVGLVRQR